MVKPLSSVTTINSTLTMPVIFIASINYTPWTNIFITYHFIIISHFPFTNPYYQINCFQLFYSPLQYNYQLLLFSHYILHLRIRPKIIINQI
jgi:hypothetical protein